MGDFNTFDRGDLDEGGWRSICELYSSRGWPPPRATSLVQQALREAGFEDAWRLQLAPLEAVPPPTCWTKTRLDYMMLSPTARSGLSVVQHQTLTSDASDHLPVVVAFRLEASSSSA